MRACLGSALVVERRLDRPTFIVTLRRPEGTSHLPVSNQSSCPPHPCPSLPSQAAAALQLVGQASEARYGKHLPSELWDKLQRANAELAPEYL